MDRSASSGAALSDQVARGLRRTARKFLEGEGYDGSEVYRVEEVGPRVFWIAYVRRGKAFVAVAAGEPRDWRFMHRFVGWPVAD